jgi:hypothetical protein
MRRISVTAYAGHEHYARRRASLAARVALERQHAAWDAHLRARYGVAAIQLCPGQMLPDRLACTVAQHPRYVRGPVVVGDVIAAGTPETGYELVRVLRLTGSAFGQQTFDGERLGRASEPDHA